MDYRTDKSEGGSDGCVNFNDPDNKGLKECILKYDYNSVYKKHCSVVSLADFIVIAAEAVMSRTATDYTPSG
jgi:hypothetical protein